MKITLDRNTEIRLTLNGSQFYIRQAAGPVDVSLETLGGQELEREKLLAGQGLVSNIPFGQVVIRNDHNIKQTIDFFVSNSAFIDNRLVGNFNVQIRQGAGVRNSVADVSAIEKIILPADQFRLKVIVTNVGSSVALIGGSFGVGLNGTPIEPGEKFIIDRAANTELWAISAAGTQLKVWEEVDTFLSPVVGPEVITTSSGAPLTINGEPLTVRNI